MIMKRNKIFLTTLLLLLLTLSVKANKAEEPKSEKKESILDRVVYIEPELIEKIPKVSRWCDRLDLKKERIDVGDAELYFVNFFLNFFKLHYPGQKKR